MERYQFKEVPKNASEEEVNKHLNEQKEEYLYYIVENYKVIYDTLKEQLKKEGHKDRRKASKEILTWAITNNTEQFEKNYNASDIHVEALDTIVNVANIIDAVNKNDEQALTKAFSELPYGDSNSGDKIALNSIKLSYWIMSDEAREKYYDIVEKYLSQTVVKDTEKSLNDYAELKGLESLKKYNQNGKEEITSENE